MLLHGTGVRPGSRLPELAAPPSALGTALREEKLRKRGSLGLDLMPNLRLDDFEDAPESEVEAVTETVVDQASAVRTIAELEAEIATLKALEELAFRVRHSGTDRKWEELSRLLQENAEMVDGTGVRRKLVIFTEHRDTLAYLVGRIGSLLGRSEAVVTIHGGMGREERHKAQAAFTQDRDVVVLVATDAAGGGHQPAARPPHGQLRPALESQSEV